MSFSSEDLEELKRRIEELETTVFKKSCKYNNALGLDDRVCYLEASCSIFARDKTDATETEELVKANKRLRIELACHELYFQGYKQWISEIWERRFGELKTEVETVRLNLQEIRKDC